LEMANIWDAIQCKPHWEIVPQQERMFAWSLQFCFMPWQWWAQIYQ
jgi:hypothetical protein